MSAKFVFQSWFIAKSAKFEDEDKFLLSHTSGHVYSTPQRDIRTAISIVSTSRVETRQSDLTEYKRVDVILRESITLEDLLIFQSFNNAVDFTSFHVNWAKRRPMLHKDVKIDVEGLQKSIGIPSKLVINVDGTEYFCDLKSVEQDTPTFYKHRLEPILPQELEDIIDNRYPWPFDDGFINSIIELEPPQAINNDEY